MESAPKIRLVLRAVGQYLLIGALIVIAAGVAREAYVAYTEAGHSSTQLQRINLDAENSIPAWFSSMLLFINAAVLGLIAFAAKSKKDPDAIYWIVLAWIFVFLSVDEAASLHERTMEPIRNALGVSGIFFFAWIIPVGAALFVMAIFYARFLLRLPLRSLLLFITAGSFYVGGAIGMEMVGGAFVAEDGYDNTPYVIAMMIEETFEIVGLMLFFIALRPHLEESFDLRVTSAPN